MSWIVSDDFQALYEQREAQARETARMAERRQLVTVLALLAAGAVAFKVLG